MKNWSYFEERFPLVMDALKGANAAGRLGHSYLLTSSNPDYRLDFPHILAKLAACTSPRPDGTPCEECETCRQITANIYPDLFLLAPTSKSREIVIGQDAAEPDTLRSFEACFHLSSITRSGWKIGIIQEADTMNENAQNAFLKTLEEPPNKCIFMLVTGRPAALLPTIRSRCQILSLTDNHCEYDYKRFSGLPELLFRLQFMSHNNLVTAEESAQALTRILSSLQEAAEQTVQSKWAARMEDAKNLESAGIKLLERRVAGESGCEYRRLREQFISMIHAWFAQTSLLASGIKNAGLPNPELMKPLSEAEKRPSLKPSEVFRMLKCAEELMAALKTNASDELAIRTFCLDVAMGGPESK